MFAVCTCLGSARVAFRKEYFLCLKKTPNINDTFIVNIISFILFTILFQFSDIVSYTFSGTRR